ncbi:transcriptional regulator [Caulobacter flavus]|uniref:Transcriptional regulator n=1 Tax=Caulobacter flavus TaxID=1679497 RepID=A0A2N5CP12_9CAUL|nr:helix-turn-helix domain-containing protein [Caulobacter flavus]AYV48608.1 transcriptional regulator [Caulobacter flavus]PLR08676.1 transcriptional regulator [Caulobacter flavus]
MSIPNDVAAERLLLAPEAAKHLRISTSTLAKYRCYGTGPVYRKNGGRIVYALADLEAWSRRGMRRSTSDFAAVTTPPAQEHAAIAPAYLERANRG